MAAARRLSENAAEKLSSPNSFLSNFHGTTINCPIPMLASWAKMAASIMPTMPRSVSMPTCKLMWLSLSAKTLTTNKKLSLRCKRQPAACPRNWVPIMAMGPETIYRHWSKTMSMLTLPPIKVKRPTKHRWIARTENWSRRISTITKPITRLPVLKDRF